MKIKLLGVFAFILTFLAGKAYSYSDHIDITVNGNYVNTDTGIIIENGVSLSPVRELSNCLGANSVNWNGNDFTVGIDTDNGYILIDLKSDTAYTDNTFQKINSDIRIINGKTYVPVRFIAEFMGADVYWNNHYKNIEITMEGHIPDKKYIDTAYNHDELFWLSRIIHAESEGEPLIGKIAVGNVILNRVQSNAFPNTIYGVIFDDAYAIQFEPVENGSIYNNPDTESVKAAKLAFRKDSVVGNCLYFFNPKKAGSSWISNNRKYYTSISNHDFYL